ncbi:MAG TPA: hypothetical protein PKY59_02790 [Pyrinomonadaceae bacterium]|nr:hypothetical protein [Pyrinomonadaceae bacterium]
MSEIRQILDELEFDSKWIELEFVAPEQLFAFWKEYKKGEDNHKEHYRWRAFKEYLKNNKSIEESNLRELYRLGEIDNDSMGVSMRIEILKRNDCPADLIDKALNSGDKDLIKFVERKLSFEQ